MNKFFMKGLKADYLSLETKNAETLYFTTDTLELFLGDKPYNQTTKFVASRPTTPAQGILYVNTVSGLVEAYDGSAWKTIVPVILNEITDSVTDAQLVSALAIKDFVEESIEDAMAEVIGGANVVSAVASKLGSNGTIEVTKGDGSKANVPLTGIAHDPTYDSENLKLTIPVVDGTDIVVNIPKDNFVQSGSYDGNTDELVLVMKQGGEVRIPAADLIDVYTTGSGVNDTVSITVGTDNKISATFKVDTTGALGIAADGKLTIDLSSYATVSSVEALEDAIDTLNGDATTTGSVAKAVADAVTGMTAVTDALDARVDEIETALTWGSF